MGLLLPLILSGVIVGLGFLLRYYHHRRRKYMKISGYGSKKNGRKENSDGFVFVCLNNKLVNKSASDPILNKTNGIMVSHDPDLELIEELIEESKN